MEEDQVFTKRFVECVKKPSEERSEQVRMCWEGERGYAASKLKLFVM